MSTPLRLHASAPRGLADLLARELRDLGADDVRERSTHVSFEGSLEVAYRACLWSRVANRIFLEIGRAEAPDAEAFYQSARALDWASHIDPRGTIACGFSGRHPAITNTHFGSLRLKDAIVDAVRDSTGTRPDVALERPDVRVHAHANDTELSFSIDLAGESLHRRAYRGDAGEAPLKENVAAGMLLRTDWPALAAAGGAFLDPLCGSGTLVVEAALMAFDIAPALRRSYFGFLGWRGHDPELWQRLLDEAQRRARAQDMRALSIRGQDRDAAAIRIARENADRAGVGAGTGFDVRPLSAAETDGAASGLVATNPPYGVRLDDRETALAVHRELGQVLRTRFEGWSAVVLSGSPEFGLELGIKAFRVHKVWNGPIECRLVRLRIGQGAFMEPGKPPRAPLADPRLAESPGARMFANRLGKNLQRLRSWVRESGVTCYRIYDADMPEYAFAIDLYQAADSEQRWLYVQEYAAPSTIEPEAARRRRGEALSVMPQVTGVPEDFIRLRTRRRSSGGEQYRKQADRETFHRVEEGGLQFWVNFGDYLDTGLFLDHRLTRERLRQSAARANFLNLFGYTGTATVYAAAGRARSTTTVDLSRTYLDWAQRNLALNGFAGRDHSFEQADCRAWLSEARARGARFELIFLDPPTFSNSKRMEGVLDVQRDHASLIDECVSLLQPGGLLVFSTNAQRFRLDEDLGARHAVRDISGATLPKDFERNPKIHRCFEIRASAHARREVSSVHDADGSKARGDAQALPTAAGPSRTTLRLSAPRHAARRARRKGR